MSVLCITGTSRGIGRVLVDHYLAKGFTVVGCSRTPLEQIPPGYTHISCDIQNEESVLHLFKMIEEKFGALDCLINNAGIGSMNHFLLTPKRTMDEIFSINVIGAALCCREAAKLMKKNEYGRIVNLVSIATPLKLEGEALYASSKAALVSLTEILAYELAPFGITVNALGPTPVETDLIRSVPKSKIVSLLKRQAIQRFATTQEVAHAIDFFLSKESNMITGQTLYFGGV